MFERILIANRGEIACRIAATCRRMGVATVAVYSDADAGARHVRMADQAVHIGPAAAAESYLDMQRILQAALDSGAQAIHPGYGFLAENPDFARAVDAAGLTLIGPSAQAMELMGSKAAAKAHMEKAGVPLIPGYHGDDQNDAVLEEQARRIGFPLMLKAAAGGGGKGMRAVRSMEGFAEALAAARREASHAFGDDRMILERLLERPRHIEAQIFADAHGNVVHLFERDCSSQRRHQKIIEEAPAAGLDPDLRQQLLEAAVTAARAVNYRGAGTVEFMVENNEFHFLEMNTRLQVEHPVTEFITGLDLVEWQLRVAAGQPLPLSQEQIPCHGHAMEARIYAEDPAQGFMPSTGRITRLELPSAVDVRVDSGVDCGDEVSVHYDPMIAKLIVHAPSREACLARLNQALAESFIAGPTTNLGFLQALASSSAFAELAVDTSLLDRNLESVLGTETTPDAALLLAAASRWLLMQEEAAAGSDSPWDIRDGWRPGQAAPRALSLQLGDQSFEVEATGHDGRYHIEFEGRSHEVGARLLDSSTLLLNMDGHGQRIQVHLDSPYRLEVCLGYRRYAVSRRARFEASDAQGPSDGRLLAPMPGKILEVRASKGETVAEGDILLIMEAMKMELSIKAPMDAVVDEVAVQAEDLVEADTLLLALEPASPAG